MVMLPRAWVMVSWGDDLKSVRKFLKAAVEALEGQGQRGRKEGTKRNQWHLQGGLLTQLHVVVDGRLHLQERHGCSGELSSARDWRAVGRATRCGELAV